MQGQLILAIRLVSDSETKSNNNYKYNHCWHSCSLNGTFCDCGNHFDQQFTHSAPKELNKYESSLTVNKKSNDDTKIGVVIGTFSNYDMALKDFRKLMEKQIDDLPPSFIFLFNNGYPVSNKQEKTIKLKHIASTDGIIDIKRKFPKTRFGVMSVYGEIFGFVFLDSSFSVTSIRSSIVNDLQEIHSFKSMQNNFFFCDRNGWPVTEDQEFHLIGYDIISDNMIKIRPYKIENNNKLLNSNDLEMSTCSKRPIVDKNSSTITLYEDTSHVDGSATTNSNLINSSEDQIIINNNAQAHKEEDLQKVSSSNVIATYHRHTYNNSNSNTNHLYHPHYYNNNLSSDSPDILNMNGLSDSFYRQHNNLVNDQTLIKPSYMPSTRKKPILISYVRKEAEQHARNLKAHLTSLGCDVYLDVDEIKVGSDWQDALNEAVNSCEVFIPLVTPNYGLTLWTNREIKFADILQKFILPVNFLRAWPPDALAIQFATTQFLPWKTKEELEEDSKYDITHWGDAFVSRTAKQISELIKTRFIDRSFMNNHEHMIDEERSNHHAQINSLGESLENSIEENETDSETDKKDELKDDDLVRINNQDVNEVDSADQQLIGTEQLNQQTASNPQPSFVALSAFGNNTFTFPQVNQQTAPNSPTYHHSSHSNQSTNAQKFNDNVLSTLTSSSKKTKSKSCNLSKQPLDSVNKKLIAISAHPAQQQVVDKLKASLTPFYNVWSSTDMLKYQELNFVNSNYSTLDSSNRDETDRSDRLSTSLNSLSSSISNSNSDQETEQNFPQVLSKDYDDPMDSKNSTLDDRTNTISSQHRYEKQHSKFEKCFYRNQITKCGKSQWYVDSHDLNSQSCVLQPDEIDKVNIFKEKVNEARIVIIVVSDDYCNSRTSKRQAYYCDFRKQILPVLMLPDVKSASHWVTKLMDNPYLIQRTDCSSECDMVDKVSHKVCNIIKEDEKLNCKVMDLKTQEFAECIQKKLILYNKQKLYVYVMGSTKFQNPQTKELCEKIGRCLAKKEKIILVTGGAVGVADTLAKSFYEERKRIRAENRKQSSASLDKEEKSMVLHCNSLKTDDHKWDINNLDVIHILPKGEVGDLKCKYRTKEDGTFEPLPYGSTVYLGDSIEDRDCTVSRVFQFCILIEGGNASAKLAQDFIYNENIVIPVCNTGGAAAGNFISEFDCGNNITEMPAGVNEDDWVALNKSDLPICELGNTIYSIIDSLAKYHQNIRCNIVTNLFDTINKRINKKKVKKATDVFNQINNMFKC